MLFVGNDVSGGEDDHTPEEVAALMRYIRDVSRVHRPEAPVFLIEVTPTPRRWEMWSRTRRISEALREVCLTSPNTWFIPTAEPFLTNDKEPRSDLFIFDGLHLNAAGYEKWSELIRRRLSEVLGKP